jgi:hypothetical protein
LALKTCGGRVFWLARCCADGVGDAPPSSLSRRLLRDSPTWTSTDAAMDAETGVAGSSSA